MNLNELARRVHKANEKWWRDLETGEPIQRNKGEMLCLIHSEISEAMEGERKNLMDDKLPHRRMAEVELADVLIRILDYAAGCGYDVNIRPGNGARDLNELARLNQYFEFTDNKGEGLCRIHMIISDCARQESFMDGSLTDRCLRTALNATLSYAAHFGYDIQGAFDEKMAYNATREDHTPEARKAEGGKKF